MLPAAHCNCPGAPNWCSAACLTSSHLPHASPQAVFALIAFAASAYLQTKGYKDGRINFMVRPDSGHQPTVQHLRQHCSTPTCAVIKPEAINTCMPCISQMVAVDGHAHSKQPCTWRRSLQLVYTTPHAYTPLRCSRA